MYTAPVSASSTYSLPWMILSPPLPSSSFSAKYACGSEGVFVVQSRRAVGGMGPRRREGRGAGAEEVVWVGVVRRQDVVEVGEVGLVSVGDVSVEEVAGVAEEEAGRMRLGYGGVGVAESGGRMVVMSQGGGMP